MNEKIGPHACDTRASEDGANNNLSQHHTPKSLNRKEAASFLSQLRPQGPWTLTAIEPDGATLTRTFDHLDKAGAFIAKHNGKRNLYYSLNPTRPGLTSKATKDDIVAAEYLHVDLDPHADETPDEAKQRYLDALEAFEPHATFVVDSGNGLQGGWKLPEALGPERYSDVEALSLAITLHLGGTAGTQNIDRILRLPGTINLPNKVKLKAGRTECPAALIKFNGACASLDDFDLDIKPQDAQKDDEDKLEKTIRDGGGKERGERSEAVFWVVCEMIRRGYLPKAIEATILDPGNGISAHVLDQSNPWKYAKRQVEQAIQKISFTTDKAGKPYSVPDNIRIALAKLDIKIRYDKFADRILLDGLKDFGPVLDDAAVDRLWLVIDKRYHFRPSQNLLRTVLQDQARLNGFHPVLDYLNKLKWDGVERTDKWLITYGGAEDSKYTRAVGALSLIAAVRRVRDPGCKFDEMLVIENEIQGTGKSTALLILAVNDDWFTDSMPLNATGQKTIETIRGKWIVEVAELRGYRAEIEQIKATLSRQRDRSRMAYGRLVEEVPRQCVFFGSTNQTKYLRDESGNRRIWPVKVKEFDLDALRRDRDQLWAEAAAREAAGASIRLDKSLWAAAAKEQDERLTNDPFLDSLQSALGEFKRAKISSDDVWKILDIKGNRTQDMTQRVSVAMKRLGWERPNDKRLVRIDGKLVIGFVRGKAPWSELEVRRSKDDGIYEWGGLTVRIKEERKPSKPLVSDEWCSTPGPWKPEANKRGKKMKKNTTRKAS